MDLPPFFAAKVRLGELPHDSGMKQPFLVCTAVFIRCDDGQPPLLTRKNRFSEKGNLAGRVLDVTECTGLHLSALVDTGSSARMQMNGIGHGMALRDGLKVTDD